MAAPSDSSFRCTHCDHRFSLAEGDEVRCPACLRKSGVVPERLFDGKAVSAAALSEGARPRMRGPALLLGVAAIAAAALAGWWFMAGPGEAPEPGGEIAAGAGDAALAAAEAAGVPRDAVQPWLSADPRVSSFALGLGVEGQGDEAKAQRLLEAFEKLHREGRFSKESTFDEGMEGPPRTAGEVAAAITAGTSPRLTPFELGALLVASLRALGAEASAAESLSASNAATAVRRKVLGAMVGAPAARFYDPFGGVMDAADKARPLTDVQVLAHGLALRAAWELSKGELKAAAQSADHAAILDPESAAVLALVGQIKVSSGMPDLGIADLAKAVRQAPDALGYYNLGVAYAADESLFKAASAFEKSTELDPTFGAGWLAQANLKAQRLALSPKDQHEAMIAEARALLDEAQAADPSLAGIATSRAQILLFEGKDDEARALLTEAVAKHPGDASTRVLLGQLAVRAGDFAEAAGHLETAAMADPDQAGIRQLLDVAYAGLEDWPRAIATYEKLLEVRPDAPDLRVALAGALREGGDEERSRSVLVEQMERFPKEPMAPLLLAQLAMDDEDWTKAAELARAANAGQESFEGVLVEYIALFHGGDKGGASALADRLPLLRERGYALGAQALLEQGEVEPAIQLLERALAKAPADVESAVTLAMAFRLTGRHDDAMRVRSEILEQVAQDQRADVEKEFEQAFAQIDEMLKAAVPPEDAP
jgi:tetratricopeptide (TPR) repeat protein/DNA-directed RNA polymerase subunit RPC12/RpoP